MLFCHCELAGDGKEKGSWIHSTGMGKAMQLGVAPIHIVHRGLLNMNYWEKVQCCCLIFAKKGEENGQNSKVHMSRIPIKFITYWEIISCKNLKAM